MSGGSDVGSRVMEVGDSQGRVHVVGNVPACVPGGGDAELVDLQIGVDDVGRHVVLIKQLVQCARVVGTGAANIALRPAPPGSKVNPGSPMGQPWVPVFWGATVGSRTKIVNRGSPRPVFSFACAGQPDQIVNL